MTYRAGSRPPVVAMASPTWIGPLPMASRSISSPPARLIAPATPPPIHKWVFAALTTASAGTRVISPCSTMMIAAPMLRSIVPREKKTIGNKRRPIGHTCTDLGWSGLPIACRVLPMALVLCLVLLSPPVGRDILAVRIFSHLGSGAGPLLGHAGAQILVFAQSGQHLERVPGGLFELLAVMEDELKQRVDHAFVAEPGHDLDRQALHVDVFVAQRLHQMIEGALPEQGKQRAHREAPHLRAGVLERLLEGFGHVGTRPRDHGVDDVPRK